MVVVVVGVVVVVVAVAVGLTFSSDAGAAMVVISSASNKTEESPAGGAGDDGEDASTFVVLGAVEVGVDEEDVAADGCFVDNRMSNAFKANALYHAFYQ